MGDGTEQLPDPSQRPTGIAVAFGGAPLQLGDAHCTVPLPTGVLHWPPTQKSFVQRLASPGQTVPSATSVLTHPPVTVESQVSVVHGLLSSHPGAAPPAQAPFAHVSPVVQGSRSSHESVLLV
jgi:hypothetical protein